jgi:clan AA aspartic protease (TIGR02281 family)
MHHPLKLLCVTLTTSLMLMAIARVAVAGPLEDGRAAFNRGDYATALRLWYSLADFGNAQAQNNIGIMYRDGLGVPRNYDEALRLFGFAIAKELPEAEYNLGDLYGRPWAKQDLKASLFWMRQAASHGYAPAQKLVGKPPFTEPEAVTHPTQSGTFRVEAPLKKEGGTFVVPVQINGAITLDFTVDSGAADVSVPADVFSTLARTGTIKDSDIIGEETYVLADGSKSQSVTFTIRSLKVGDRIVENVRGSVAPSRGSLLLGQSFLERFKSWSIDNTKHVLLLEVQ